MEGKVALVTGAGQGTGELIAVALAAAGARVAVNDINPDRAERVAAAIRETGGSALAVDADVSNRFHCVKLIEGTRAEWGRLDILVNNARVTPASPVLKMDEWDWDRCLDVNLKGAFFMSQLVGRVMADENQERGGTIVNIASVAGVAVPWEQRAAFCASQAGIAGFTRECARELAAYGLRVYALLRSIDPDEAEQQAIAQIVIALCSTARRQLNGAVLTVEEALALP